MHLGLRLRFQRDLAFQFQRKNEPISAAYIDKKWSVLGSTDFLEISTLDSLSALASPHPAQTSAQSLSGNPNSIESTPLGGLSELILHPAGKFNTEDWGTLHHELQNHPLLFYVRGTISSLAFDLPSDMLAAAGVVTNSFALIEDTLARARVDAAQWDPPLQGYPSVTFWETLGGPDLACLSFIKDAESLAFLTHFLAKLRKRTLSGLLKDISCPTTPEAHAFSSVQASLCFHSQNGVLANIISSPPFIAAEKWHRISYPCRIAPGTGHEEEVLLKVDETIASLNLDEGSPPELNTTWGHRAIHVQFHHLAHVVKTLFALQTSADPAYRSTNIHSIRTTVSSPYMQGSGSQPGEICGHPGVSVAWSDDVDKLLDAFWVAQRTFSQKYLGESQAHEFEQLYLSLAAALRRNDRAASVRDLMPFFDQLRRCIGDDELWERFSQSNTFNEISNELSSLFSHLWRALRNRIEHRAEPLDPSFPNSLEYGASKLLNAYTVAAWVASELLFRLDSEDLNGELDRSCPKDYFSAAVCAGTWGAVDARILFSSLRTDHEPLVRRGDSAIWNAPLLAMSLSGPTLFHPEEAFVHCLHEMAEASNWIMSERARPLRTAMNRWAFHYYVRLLRDALNSTLGPTTSEQVFSDDERNAWILDCIVFLEGIAAHPKEYIDLQQIKNQVLREPFGISRELDDVTPIGLLTHLSITVPGASPETIAAAAQLSHLRKVNWSALEFTGGVPHWLRNGALSAAHEEQFATDLESGSFLRKATIREYCANAIEPITEIIADFAMISVLNRILLSGTPAARVNIDSHITAAFKSILKAISSACHHPTPRHREIGVLRWAVQFAVWSEHKDARTQFQRHLDHNRREINGYFDRSIARHGWNPNWTAEWMRENWDKHPEYFDTSSQFSLASELRLIKNDVVLWNFEDHHVVKAIITDFTSIWNPAVRGDASVQLDKMRLTFVSHLWAKAQKFCVGSLFELVNK